MENQWIGFLTVGVAIAASHAMLRRNLAAIRESLTTLEGTVDRFIAGFWARQDPPGQGPRPS